jgi:hypothetical protein
LKVFPILAKQIYQKRNAGIMQNLLKKRWFIDKKEIASQHSWQADDPKTEKTNKSVLTSTFTRQT